MCEVRKCAVAKGVNSCDACVEVSTCETIKSMRAYQKQAEATFLKSKLTAPCGINCAECGAYIAHKTNDEDVRVKTAAMWSVMHDFDCKPEMINCSGCRREGVKGIYCGMCGVRKCAIEKGVETCAACPESATCKTFAEMGEIGAEAVARLNNAIAYCGLKCYLCPVYIATKNNDDEARAKIAAEWTAADPEGAKYTTDMINCTGCKSAGGVKIFCHESCEVRKCAISKGIGACETCAEFPTCPTAQPSVEHMVKEAKWNN